MDRVCVIGYGMVGKALADVFGIKKIYTRNPKESTITLEEASKCRLVFICLPTPVYENGVYLVEDIIKVVQEIERFGNEPVYVIRSTVFPGFAQLLQSKLSTARIVSNPEFLSEATAIEDTTHPPFILIGGVVLNYMKQVESFYAGRIKSAPVILTDNITAEMAKLTMNAYFSTKVMFANQTYDACQSYGANYATVKAILESHPYGPKNHFDVFFRGKRGIHGKCLPKDSRAYAYYTDSSIVKAVVKSNDKLLEREKNNG